MYKSSILPPKNLPTSLNNVSSINQSYPAVYNRNYLILKSQYTVLENLQPRIENPPLSMTWEDKQKLAFIGFLIESLKEIKFGHVFHAADSTIASIRSLLDSPNIHSENAKLLNTLMNATLTINQICNTLNAILSSNHNNLNNVECVDDDNEIDINQLSPTQNFFQEPASIYDNLDNEFIVCRICDEKIPASLIEAHTESCLTRYRSESRIKNLNDHLGKIQQNLNDVYLEVPWPGPPQEAVDVLFPVLHLMILLERARNLDPHISDTIDELTFIQSVISSFISSDSMNNVPTLSGQSKIGQEYKPKSSKYFLQKSLKLIGEKIKTSNALNNALLVSRQTRLTSNNDSFYDKNFGKGEGEIEKKTTIADFNFIKRISKGAYASVFLATKKTTGDIFAIKVTPKSSLKQKNQVRRILIEKDILLQFSNPFIVTFCMYFS